jgi:hypothetical protein
MGQPDPLRRNLILFFAAIILASGVALVWIFGGLALRDWRIATHYREAECEILSLQMMPRAKKVQYNFFRRRHPGNIPVFTFRFVADGRTITTAGFDALDGRDARAEDYTHFRTGERYPCWFDPEEPTRAVLVKDWRPQRYFGTLALLGVMGLAGLFLRGIVGGPPIVWTGPKAAQPVLPDNRAPTARPVPWKWLALSACVVAFLSLTMVVPILAQRRERAALPAIEGAQHDGPALLARLGLPPEAKAAGFRVTDRGPKGRKAADAGWAWLLWGDTLETPHTFTDTIAWYGAKLSPEGWRTHRPAEANSAEFCREQWRLRLDRTASGCTVRLEWNNRIEPCVHP